ncbi:multicopper oxidase family protein [Nonomuraea africana]|uniref:FtsP/CotA-like multicopper oxidase with cupredoxin domain n=1 Tax=Nonomuraea africana TaxID=46171 RepID=A0ABR9K5S3_9ACTN|nr:multicopper oxidase family protein [Nonomuraea africana]MBE1557357.1 FtsP/CotA-like multicopper oxidase with cupredoxin domain [Nonomuraea africana]
MFEPLFLTDMLLAFAVMAAAATLGWTAGRRRWVLYGTAALVLARLVVAGLLLTGGLPLADTRLFIQIPLAVVPLALAFHRPEARRPAAVGVGLSALWLFFPYAQHETLFTLAVSLLAMGVTFRLTRRRGPWATLGFLAAPAVLLILAYQGNVAAAVGHHAVPMAWDGGAAHGGHASASRPGSVSVTELTGPRDQTPDVRVTLTAAHGKVTLASGREIDALTFNGQAPGPQIRVRKGQLLEVTLLNADVKEGVTLHWHGIDVPNAEDGVPGVTQEAVLPGGKHVYRFVPDRTGTFWYHTHRDSSLTVERGLFGSLIVEDGQQGVEKTVFTHLWPGADDPIAAFGTADQPVKQAIGAGRPVLLRLVNSSEEPHRLHIGGTPYTVTAIDGNPVQGATPVAQGTDLLLAAGGRFDVTFTMPSSAVTLSIDVNEIPNTAALAFSPDGGAPPAPAATGPLFDPLTYGAAAPVKAEAYDRTFDLRLDDGFGFALGSFTYVSSSMNGRLYPSVPMLMVAEGDRVRMRIVNRSLIDHPMHLHGHRVRVLSRNGVAATGSTWWTDTLNVAPGEIFEVDFTADNPGIWMDHCHNFKHGSEGMIMHLGYAGVTTPFTEDHIPE